MPMRITSIKSYAKINIGLRIHAKRPDGYHDLETLFKLVDLHDDITLDDDVSGDVNVSCSDPSVPADDSNLCHRAVRKLQSLTARPFGVKIDIAKRIPIGAGLGGGSSNAAAVLVGCRNRLALEISDEALMRAGAELGSDVPFFVGAYLGRGHTAFGKGRGDILEFVDWTLPEKVVLLNPGITISTAWAYANYARKLTADAVSEGSFNLTNRVESIKFSPLLAKPLFFGNYFEPLVFAEYPKIKVLRDLLEQKGAKIARLSGSGATVFGIFEENADLEKWPTAIEDCFVHVGTFV